MQEKYRLDSMEHNRCYYQFVTRNGTELYIRVQAKHRSARNEIVDLNKKVVVIDLKCIGYGKENNEQLLDYLLKFLQVRKDQLQIVSGLEKEHKMLKLTGYNKTRFDIMFKCMDTWEDLFFPTTEPPFAEF